MDSLAFLYVSDHYNDHVNGTKKVLYQELVKRNYQTVFVDFHGLESKEEILTLCKEKSLNCVLIVNTMREESKWLETHVLNQNGIWVHGFGLSDPTKWKQKHLTQYNSYSTSSWKIYQELVILKHYWPTCIDPSFFIPNFSQPKTIDILFYGGATLHRKEMLNQLEKDFDIQVYGSGWGENREYLQGQRLVEIINMSKIGIDLSEDKEPIPRRIFEMGACRVPVVIKKTVETLHLFPSLIDYMYNDLQEAKFLLSSLLENPEFYQATLKQQISVFENHTIERRTTDLLNFLNQTISIGA